MRAKKSKGFLNRLLSYGTGLAIVNFSVTLFLLPVVSLYFHRISLVGLLANLTVIPILGLWIIPLSLLSAAILPVSSQAAGFLLALSLWGLRAMMEMVHFWSSLPWSSLWTLTPTPFEMALFYGLLAFIFLFKACPFKKTVMVVLVLFISADVTYWFFQVRLNRDLKVTFLDVGQANSALVEFPGGEKMLIDGGGFPRDHFDLGKMVIAPVLWQAKIKRIHYLVLSHPQADHMNGLRFIAENFHPKEFWFNGVQVDTAAFKELMAIVDSKKIKKVFPKDLKAGRNINGVRVEVLHPFYDEGGPDNQVRKSGLNNQSMVIKLCFRGLSFLFPGDLEKQGESILLHHAGNAVRSHVLLCPHHGSKSSSTLPFLKKVSPRICVISSGEGNFFGFPHDETIRRLNEIDCRILRIDQRGAIKMTVNRDGLRISTFVK